MYWQRNFTSYESLKLNFKGTVFSNKKDQMDDFDKSCNTTQQVKFNHKIRDQRTLEKWLN